MNKRACVVALGAAVVSSIFAMGCAVENEEDPSSSSDQAINARPVAICRANGNMRKAPSQGSTSTSSVNGTVNVYCKTTGIAPQPGWSSTWIGATLRPELNLSYVHESVFSSCDGGRTLANVLPSLPDCSTLVTVPSVSGGSPSSGSPSGAASHEVELLSPPADAQTFPARGAAPIRMAGSSFNAPITVHRSAPGTIEVGAVWNAYDAQNRRIGSGRCNADRAYAGTYEGLFTCSGGSVGATHIDLVYWARGPIDFSRR
jgi:hypothetical protein